MELLQLTYFCDAAETENFSHTAAKFNVPTSNISQTVKRLEKELGVSLFDRCSNRIILNEHGKTFYAGVKKGLASIFDAKEEISTTDQSVCGEIHLLVSTNRRIVTMAIEEFCAEYPDVSFVLNHGQIKTGVANFYISDTPPAISGLSSESLIVEKLMLAARRDLHLNDQPITVSILKEQKFISMTEGTRLHTRTVEACRNMGFYPKFALETDDPFYVRKYVEMGVGVAIVPSVSWHGLFSDEVELIDIDAGFRNTFVFYDGGRRMSRTAQLFLEKLRSVFTSASNMAQI